MENFTLTLMDKLLRVEALLHRHQSSCSRSHGPYRNPQRGQGRVLSLLKIQPQISQKELSYLLDMRQQSLSELLAKLERRGFIKRMPSKDDRRVTMITLTEEGNEAAPDAEANEAAYGDVFSCLTEEEQQSMGQYLDRMIEALEKELEAAEDGESSAPDSTHAHGRHFHDRYDRDRHRGHGPMPSYEDPRHWEHNHRGPCRANECPAGDHRRGCNRPYGHETPDGKSNRQIDSSKDADAHPETGSPHNDENDQQI